MPIPAFNIDGVIPPFIGPNGPGGALEDMSPYRATSLEVVVRFGTSPHRRQLLRNWLQFRHQLRLLPLSEAFQWLDGSFVEDKEPNDIDLVLFFKSPAFEDFAALQAFRNQATPLLTRANVRANYTIDLLMVDLAGTSKVVVNATRYYVGLFSHRRDDGLWKGMVEVELDTVLDDLAALAELDAMEAQNVQP